MGCLVFGCSVGYGHLSLFKGLVTSYQLQTGGKLNKGDEIQSPGFERKKVGYRNDKIKCFLYLYFWQ